MNILKSSEIFPSPEIYNDCECEQERPEYRSNQHQTAHYFLLRIVLAQTYMGVAMNQEFKNREAICEYKKSKYRNQVHCIKDLLSIWSRVEVSV